MFLLKDEALVLENQA